MKKEPLDIILSIGKHLRAARTILHQDYLNLPGQLAAAHVIYAAGNLAPAIDILKKAGNEFPAMIPQSACEPLGESLELLQSGDEISLIAALGKIARAHMMLRKFHLSLGYREITDEDLDNASYFGAGGGR